MTSPERRLTLPARLDQIETACDFVAEQAEQPGMDAEAVYHCRLSVEEIFTNVVEHGYAGQPDGVIELVCQVLSGMFVITVIDDAPPFDPLSLPEPDPGTPLWERKGGGWGVYFVRRFMDRVQYVHRDHRNHLIMEKRLG